jgi:GNAT superfamily N-acetyltransferase
MTNEILSWKNEYFHISTDKSLLQIERIHHFLSHDSYWSPGIPLTVVARAIENSLCFGLYGPNTKQMGFARVVTDHAGFAWICDVYIETEVHGQGLSKWLMSCVMSHLALINLRRICLATKDAHELYKKFGVEVTQSPQNWLEIKDNDIYKKLQS